MTKEDCPVTPYTPKDSMYTPRDSMYTPKNWCPEPPAEPTYLLLEDGSFLLLENDGKILL